MFDIGFAEIIIIGVVALLVIGPERLPGTIRTATLYLGKLRRGFNEIKREVQNELHNDAVMSELRESGNQLQQETQALGKEFKDSAEKLAGVASMGPPSTGSPITASQSNDHIAQTAKTGHAEPSDTAPEYTEKDSNP